MNTINILQNSPPAIFIVLYIWSLVWKGLALWQAANNKQRNWFIAIVVLNTAGIIEILYLFRFAKKTFTMQKLLNTILFWQTEK